MFDEVTHIIHDDEPAAEQELRDVEVHVPNPLREAVADVVSMRGLARAFAAVVSPPKDSFDRALARTLNPTGSIAAGMLREPE